MAFLTRRIQKLIGPVALLISLSLFFALHHSNYDSEELIKNLNTGRKKLDEVGYNLGYNVGYYQDLMRNYTLSFYSDVSPLNPTIGHSDGANSRLEELLAPLVLPEAESKRALLKENKQLLKRILGKPISEPKNMKLQKISELDEPNKYVLENATFVSLVRNSELEGIKSSIVQIEETFNGEYHYPYVFLNDEAFTEEFKAAIQNVTRSACFFEQVDSKDWSKPSFIDPGEEKKGIEYQQKHGVGYADMESYHNMCRYYSIGFYKHPRMQQFKYYWRIEPSTNYFCKISYDVFKFMRDNDKVYGYVLNLYDNPSSVKSLWPVTIEFLTQNGHYIHDNAALTYLRENQLNPGNSVEASGYSTCHFWSNFEIGDMDFYRDEAYSKWAEHLDMSGGFYYERWGDAPVHSIGLSLFADKSKIHWFRDIGYEHLPYFNCPVSEQCNGKCKKGVFSNFGSNLDDQNCQPVWIKYEMNETELENY